jgi:hypothetical protein
MNKTWVTVGVVVVAIAIIGAIMYAKGSGDVAENTSPTNTTNTTGNTNSGTNSGTGSGNGQTTNSGVPVVITDPKSYPTDTTAIVKGTINPQGAITSYWYEYSISTDSFPNKTATQVIGSGFSAIPTPAYIVGLSKNTEYHFRLVGENRFGKISDTIYSFKTSEGTPPPVGSAPTVKSVSASSISKTTVNLRGEVTSNKNATQYWFEYGQTAELGSASAFSSVTNDAVKTSVSISLSDLTPATTYYFRLNAQNQFGTVNGSILNFKTSNK